MCDDIPTTVQISNFLRGQSDPRFMRMWCRIQCQRYIDKNIDDANRDALLDVYFGKLKPYRFSNVRGWLQDNEAILHTLPRSRIDTMTFKTKTQVATLVRMVYFLELMVENTEVTPVVVNAFKELFMPSPNILYKVEKRRVTC